jgi:hypothetical protein
MRPQLQSQEKLPHLNGKHFRLFRSEKDLAETAAVAASSGHQHELPRTMVDKDPTEQAPFLTALSLKVSVLFERVGRRGTRPQLGATHCERAEHSVDILLCWSGDAATGKQRRPRSPPQISILEKSCGKSRRRSHESLSFESIFQDAGIEGGLTR